MFLLFETYKINIFNIEAHWIAQQNGEKST